MKNTILLLLLFFSSTAIQAQGLLTKFGINAANKTFVISHYEKEFSTRQKI